MKIHCKNALPNSNNVAYCAWQGKLSEWNDHDMICEYKSTRCIYCKQYKCCKKDMKNHFPLCQYYPILCYLNCGKRIKRKDMDNHVNNICDNKLITCTNNGCNEEIKRMNHYIHVYHQCIKRLIDCDYKDYGCNIGLIPNDTKSQHMQQNKMDHILLKVNYMETELTSMKLENKKLKTYINKYITKPSFTITDTGVLYFPTNQINHKVSQYKLRWCLLPKQLRYILKDGTIEFGRISAEINYLSNDDNKANNIELKWQNEYLNGNIHHYNISKIKPKPSIKNPYVYQLQCETEYGWSQWSSIHVITSIWENPNIGFNEFNSEYFSVSNNNKIIESISKKGHYRIAYDNNGLKNIGKYHIQIRCIKCDAGYNTVGVISNKIDIDKYNGYNNESECFTYCYDGNNKRLYSRTPIGVKKYDAIKWGINDIIQIKLNFEESTIIFYLNDMYIEKLILFDAPEYYVFIQSYKNGDSYEIL